jgi:hypothetical protein
MIPHKCPCCDGRGQRFRLRLPHEGLTCAPDLVAVEMCAACSGSGIVWGPGSFVPTTLPANPLAPIMPPYEITYEVRDAQR